jgi:Galactosyltransferase
MRLLIGIVSCQRYGDRRESCRRSWMQSVVRHPWVQALFVVGSAGASVPYQGGDTLFVPCADDYDHLPQKTLWLVQWATEHGFDFLFKCDDDTYVHVDRLATALRDEPVMDFRGYEVVPGLAAGGAGYLLSSQSLSHLLSVPGRRSAVGAEDVLVSQWLAAAGIKIEHDQRFWSWASKVPTVWNSQITAHYVQPPEMSQLHRSLTTAPPLMFRVLDGYTEYGAVGVNGYRGFSVKGAAVVELPQNSPFARVPLISAHASSWVEVETDVDLSVQGFLDAASHGCATRVDLLVDGMPVGRLIDPDDISDKVIAAPGRHHLEALACGKNRCCYSVWALEPNAAMI